MKQQVKYSIIAFLLTAVLVTRPKLTEYARLLGTAGDAPSKSKRSNQITGKSAKNVNDPSDLGKAGWKRALKRTKQALKDKNLAASAAALSYYTTLAFFPIVIGVASLLVIVVGQQGLLNMIAGLQGLIPDTIYVMLERQLTPIAESGAKVGVALAASIAALLWAASGGFQNLIRATDKAYEVKESRNLIKLRLVSLALSIVVLIIGGAIMVLLLLQPGALLELGFPNSAAELLPIIRWPILVVLVSVLLAAIYRYAPDRKQPHWQWVSWGAVAATFIWLIATIGFFLYVQHFGNYTKTYGAFAGLIVLMIWFNISSLIVLLGAQVNKKLEEVAPPQSTE